MAGTPRLGLRRGIVLGASLAVPIALVFGLGHRGVHMMRSMVVPGAGLVGSSNLLAAACLLAAVGATVAWVRWGMDWLLAAVVVGAVVASGLVSDVARCRHDVDGVDRFGGAPGGGLTRVPTGPAGRRTDLLAAHGRRAHSGTVAPGPSPRPHLRGSGVGRPPAPRRPLAHGGGRGIGGRHRTRRRHRHRSGDRAASATCRYVGPIPVRRRLVPHRSRARPRRR